MVSDKFLVQVICWTYNHSAFIEATMNGFCIQETKFPYVCILLDDASTDEEQTVISKFLQRNFNLQDRSTFRIEETDDYVLTFARHKDNQNCYFAVFYLKYNHYSIGKTKSPYYEELGSSAKYIALCEGDDYWTVPQKLQKQIDYLESHSDCTMTCNRAFLYSEGDKKIIGEQYCRKGNGMLSQADVINRTGLYIPTCSLIYKKWITNNYPSYCTNCNVLDYPLQITAAVKGYIYYFDDVMSLYRIDHNSSWTSHQKFQSMDPSRLQIVRSQLIMFKGFMDDYPQLKNVFFDKMQEHIWKNMPFWRYSTWKERRQYLNLFSDIKKMACLKWKIYMWICLLPIPKIKNIYRDTFLKKYTQLKKYY